MKRVLLLLVLTSLAFGQQYVNNTPATENPISDGGKWTNAKLATGSNCYSNVQVDAAQHIIGTQVSPASPSANCDFNDSLAMMSNTWNPNQCAQGTLFIASGGITATFAEVELFLRTAIIGTNYRGYEVQFGVLNQTGKRYWHVAPRLGADFLGFGNDISTSTLGRALQTGDIIKACVVGSTFTISIKKIDTGTWVQIGQGTDSTYATGAPGVGFYHDSVGNGHDSQWGFSTFSAANAMPNDCNSGTIQTAIGTSSTGDTVLVPGGSCTWNGLSLNKAITLQGAGQGVSNVALSGTNTFTKQASGPSYIKGFTFSASGGGNANQPMFIPGTTTTPNMWKATRPIVFQNDTFNISNSGLFRIQVAGGTVFSNDIFTAGWDDTIFQVKNDTDSDGSWQNADTFGTRDAASTLSGTIAGTTGELNHYIEDSTFTGGSNASMDCDDACRMVIRHNHYIDSSVNSHGYDTSNWGMRQFEIYNNDFRNTCSEAGGNNAAICGTVTASLPNVNQQIWIRGASGIIANNQMENNSNSWWGSKPQVRLNIRAVSQPSLIGKTCANLTYPITRALGRNFNGTSEFTDPIYIWGNTVKVQGSSGSSWGVAEIDNAGGPWPGGEQCSPLLNWNTFFQWGRDAINQAILGGSAKPGYTSFAYPHPLATGGAVTTFSESGTISGFSVAGIVMTLSGTAAGSTTSDASGNYSFNGLGNGSYTVTPSKAGSIFVPSSQNFTINNANVTGINFTSSSGSAFSISGQVTGASVNGVTMTLSGTSSGSTTTDASGNYSFTGLANGSYTVTPTKTGQTFSPTSSPVTINNANVTGVNFVSSLLTFSISGTVTGPSVSGVTITRTGTSSGSTTTDGSGNYTFTGLTNGSYTITPSKLGYTFSAPANVTISGANVTGTNFTEVPSPPSIFQVVVN